MTGPSEQTHVRRHLTGVRRRVLQIIAACGPITVDEIAVEWAAAQPSMPERQKDGLPRMASQVVWRLENLGWISRHGDGYVATPAGRDLVDDGWLQNCHDGRMSNQDAASREVPPA
ncbi:hypothetical protein [Microbacterium sp. zg.Y909]|uniref:hypothetical protein n=1 Tax=Microbacterium sp. zg.Y909 TaxID=2969413 RepID=UPI00214A9DC0|nr:hypothetical protein [Microbacterium sp. zg.Y909]MCR2827462.1 hypothetical protein [Microbacterium sp. zg.Y909]